MAKRISLVEGIERDRELLDPVVVESFLKHGSAEPIELTTQPAGEEPELAPKAPVVAERRVQLVPQAQKTAAVMSPGLIPVNVRVRPDIAAALQTASLQRQLQGVEPASKREIVEQALEPWLRKNGYL